MATRLAMVGLGVLASCAAPPWDSAHDPNLGEPAIVLLFPETSTSARYCPALTAVAEIDGFRLTEDDDLGLQSGQWQLVDVFADGVRLVGSSATSFVDITEDAPLALGYHQLVAELVDGAGQPLEPPARFQAYIHVDDTQGCLGGSWEPE